MKSFRFDIQTGKNLIGDLDPGIIFFLAELGLNV